MLVLYCVDLEKVVGVFSSHKKVADKIKEELKKNFNELEEKRQFVEGSEKILWGGGDAVSGTCKIVEPDDFIVSGCMSFICKEFELDK